MTHALPFTCKAATIAAKQAQQLTTADIRTRQHPDSFQVYDTFHSAGIAKQGTTAYAQTPHHSCRTCSHHVEPAASTAAAAASTGPLVTASATADVLVPTPCRTVTCLLAAPAAAVATAAASTAPLAAAAPTAAAVLVPTPCRTVTCPCPAPHRTGCAYALCSTHTTGGRRTHTKIHRACASS